MLLFGGLFSNNMPFRFCDEMSQVLYQASDKNMVSLKFCDNILTFEQIITENGTYFKTK